MSSVKKTFYVMPLSKSGSPIQNKVEYPDRESTKIVREGESATFYVQKKGDQISYFVKFHMNSLGVYYTFEVYLDGQHLLITEIISNKLKLIIQACDESGTVYGNQKITIANDVVQLTNENGFIIDFGSENISIVEDDYHIKYIYSGTTKIARCLNDYAFAIPIENFVAEFYTASFWKKSINQFRVVSTNILQKLELNISDTSYYDQITSTKKNIFYLEQTLYPSKVGIISYDRDLRKLYFYDITSSGLTLIRTIDVSTFQSPRDTRIRFHENLSGFCANTNSIVFDTEIDNWRGYSDVDGKFIVRLPLLDINGPNNVEDNLTGDFGSIKTIMSDFGSMWFVQKIWGHSDQDMFHRRLHLQGVLADITESYYNGRYVPSDCDQWSVFSKVVGTSGRFVFVSAYVSYDDDDYAEFCGYRKSMFRVYESDDFYGSRLLRSEERSVDYGFLFSVGQEIDGVVTYSLWSEAYHYLLSIRRCIVHNGKIYCFIHTSSGPLCDRNMIRVYDFTTYEILTEKILTEDGIYLGYQFIEYISWNDQMIFAISLIPWSRGNLLYLFLDADTLEDVVFPSIPHEFFNLSIFNYTDLNTKFVTDINQARSEATPIVRPFPYHSSYSQPISFLGFSPKLSVFAHAHLYNWCVPNKKMAHIKENTSLNQFQYNILYYQDVLAIFDCLDTDDDEIDRAINLWKESPGHWSALMEYENLSIGWSVATFPSSVTELQIGPGLYINGSYTTNWTTYTIPEESIGKLRIMCAVLAAG